MHSQLRHPNIIQLYSSAQVDQNLFFVLELANNGELFDFVSPGLPPMCAWFYFHQLCDAVEYFHKQGGCHRDLKLENLLLVRNF